MPERYAEDQQKGGKGRRGATNHRLESWHSSWGRPPSISIRRPVWPKECVYLASMLLIIQALFEPTRGLGLG
ncbi:hypothetical protein LY78DRAFT_656456 [Colletotrichum sublineola]|nr:hypothetical protein LY78DRAFT_656456 [Colletotrichum sublineola]